MAFAWWCHNGWVIICSLCLPCRDIHGVTSEHCPWEDTIPGSGEEITCINAPNGLHKVRPPWMFCLCNSPKSSKSLGKKLGYCLLYAFNLCSGVLADRHLSLKMPFLTIVTIQCSQWTVSIVHHPMANVSPVIWLSASQEKLQLPKYF